MVPYGHFRKSATQQEVFDYWWRRGCRNEFQFEEPCIKCSYRFECASIWILALYSTPFEKLFRVICLLHLYKVFPDGHLLSYYGKTIRPNFVKEQFRNFRQHWRVAFPSREPVSALPPLVFPVERLDYEQFYRIGGIIRTFLSIHESVGKKPYVFVPSDTGLEVFRWRELIESNKIFAIRRSTKRTQELPLFEQVYKEVSDQLEEVFLPAPVPPPPRHIGMLVMMLSSLRQLLRWSSWIYSHRRIKYLVLGLPRIEYLRVVSWFFMPWGIEYFELSPTPILVFAEVVPRVTKLYRSALGRSERFSARLAKWTCGKSG